jgi:hypothetical protein
MGAKPHPFEHKLGDVSELGADADVSEQMLVRAARAPPTPVPV